MALSLEEKKSSDLQQEVNKLKEELTALKSSQVGQSKDQKLEEVFQENYMKSFMIIELKQEVSNLEQKITEMKLQRNLE